MSPSTIAAPATKPQPVLIAGTVITFCSVVFGGLTLVAGLGDNPTVAVVSGVGMLITGAANQALAFWTKGVVVPLPDVGTYLNAAREPVDGPAAAEVDRKANGRGRLEH